MLTKEQHEQISASLNKMTWAALNTYRAVQHRIEELSEFTYGRKLSEIDKPQKCPPKTIYNAARAQLDKLFLQADVLWGVYLSASEAEEKMWRTPYLVKDDLFGDYVVDLSKPVESVGTETKETATENGAEALSA